MVLSKYLDPKNNFAFKRIFGLEKNKDILICFLNDVLELSEDQRIKDIKFLNPVQDPEIASKKESIVDVLCRDLKGAMFICEMQVARTTGFQKRAVYYAAKAYANQADVRGRYQDLKEVIFIGILDFTLFTNKCEFKSAHRILDIDSLENNLADFTFVFIELPKFYKNKNELESRLDKWCFFLKYASETKEEELYDIVGHDEIIRKAYDQLVKYNWKQEDRDQYEKEKKMQDDYLSCINQSMEEGIAKGIAKGRAEEKAEVAKILVKEGIPFEVITKSTGLKLDEIKNLCTIDV